MQKSRILTVLLLLAMLSSVGGCTQETPTTPEVDTSTDTPAADVIESETAESRLLPDIPVKDFGGASFTVLDFNEGEGFGSIHNAFEFYAEEYNGEMINDAVFDRNMRIQETYNIVVAEIGIMEPAAEALRAVTAGDDLYSVCVDRTERMAGRSQDGCFLSLFDVPYIDLDQPWWDQHAQAEFSIGGNLYFTTGDYLLFDKLRIYSMYANQDMMTDHGMGDIYDIVNDGTWTFDLMNTLSQSVAQDLNGNGVMGYREDLYGLVLGSYDCYEGFFSGMQNRTTTKDENDLPVFCLMTERAVSSIEKLTALCNDENVSIYGQVATENWSLAGSPQYIFEEGRGLFYQEVLQVALLLDTDINYAIIPLPKYDEEQAEYITSSQYLLAMAIAVPKSTADLDMVGIILEAMSADSMYSTRPAFIETVLKVKKAPDKRASAVLDMLLDSIHYDVGMMYNWGGYYSLISDTLPRGSKTEFASAYASKEKAAMNAMQKTIDVFTAID